MNLPLLPPWWRQWGAAYSIPDSVVQALLKELKIEITRDPRRELASLVLLGGECLAKGKRIDPYLFWVLARWLRRLLDAYVAGTLSAELQVFYATRLSMLAAFSPGKAQDPLKRFEADGVETTHLHATQLPGLRVRPCRCSWAGLRAMLTALRDEDDNAKDALVALQACVQLDENRQFDPARNQRQVQSQPLGDYAPMYEARKRAQALSRQGTKQNVQDPLVGVIDDMCNFARWSGGDASPLVGLWHQGTDIDTVRRVGVSDWFKPAFEATAAWPQVGRLNQPVLSGAVGGYRLNVDLATIADEAGAYRNARYLDPIQSFTHGSGVMHLICDGLPGNRPQVMFVQLPIASVLDTGGASLASHALDGIHHVLEATLPGRTVIVNLSYGTHSGPHDGSSLWDQALAELLNRFDGSEAAEGKTLHVVLPAGNGHRSRSHAHLHVSDSVRSRSLHWFVAPEDRTSNHLELWFPKDVVPSITVRSPVGTTLSMSRHGIESNTDAGMTVVFPRACAQSAHGTFALISVGATLSQPQYPYEPSTTGPVLMHYGLDALEAAKAAPAASAPSPSGVWTVTVAQGSSPLSKDFQFHAWVMRGDSAPNRRQARHGNPGKQPYLLDIDGDQIDPHFTLNGIACLEHERLWVVGAMRRDDKSLSPYSASGPNRWSGDARQQSWRSLGPTVVFPGDESLFQPGLLAGGSMSGSRLRMSGTSMAAAAFTRHLYDHLRAGLPASTATLPRVAGASRMSPTGHPQVQDAAATTRGQGARHLPP